MDARDYNLCSEAFEKVKKFSNSDWPLPRLQETFSGSSYFIREDLQKLQKSLNGCKSKLDDFPRGDWHPHALSRNLASSLLYCLRKKGIELVTRSWPKLWEILHKFKVVPDPGDSLRSLHLCESHGSYLGALNQFIKQRYSNACQFEWMANSLNPHYEGQSHDTNADDRLICRKADHWIFGPDGTGDLTQSGLVEFILDKYDHVRRNV